MSVREELQQYAKELNESLEKTGTFLTSDEFHNVTMIGYVNAALALGDKDLEGLTMDEALFKTAKYIHRNDPRIKFED